MKLDVFSLIVLLGALQALFFGIYLYFSPNDNKLQKRSLAFLILILSYNGFETLNWSSELFKFMYLFNLFPFVLIFGLGASFYLYVRSFRTAVPVRNAWRYYIFLWAAFTIRSSLLVIWILHVNGKQAVLDPFLLDAWYGAILEPLSVIVFTVFYVMALREYRLLVRMPEEEKMVTRWLKLLLTVMGVFALLWICTVGLPFFMNIGAEKYYVIEICLVVFIYWIGYTSYHRTRVIYVTRQKKTQSYFDNLPAAEVDSCIRALQLAMEKEKLYLDPALTTASLAAHISVHAKTLSAVLNQGLQKGFSEYVNTWRV